MSVLTTIIIGDEYTDKKLINNNLITSIKKYYSIDSDPNIHYTSIKNFKLTLSKIEINERHILCIMWVRSGTNNILDIILPAQQYLTKFLKKDNNLLLFSEPIEPYDFTSVFESLFKKENYKKIKYLTPNIDITNNNIEIIRFFSAIPYQFPTLEKLQNNPIQIKTDFFIPCKTIRATKHTVMSMLQHAGLLESNDYTYKLQNVQKKLLTFTKKHLIEYFKDSPQISLLEDSLQTKIEPKFIDIPKKEEDGIKYGNAHINQELLDLHKNCMIGVVVEDFYYFLNNKFEKYDEFNLITEKTVNFMYCKKPFIMFQCRHFLKHFNEMGFKSFSPFINEEYDIIQDDITRFKAVIEEMKRIANLSPKDKIILQNNLIETCEHNFNVLSEKYHNNNLLL